jgi:hypothetical protein
VVAAAAVAAAAAAEPHAMTRTPSQRRRRRLLVGVALLAEPLALKLRGLPLGGNVVVRCREGHLFTTLWVPSVSLKAVRLGWWRFQRCPVGGHWSLVTPVKESELTHTERRRARGRKDVRIP